MILLPVSSAALLPCQTYIPRWNGWVSEPLQEQPARHRVQPLRGARPRRRPRSRPLRRGRRCDRPRDPGGGRPARARGPRGVVRRQRPQPAGLRPGDAHRAAARVVQEELRRLEDAEYWRLQIPEALGGTPAPSSLVWAIGELVLGANAPVWMYGAGPAFASVMHRNGNDRDKVIAQHIVDRGWTTSMVLTEPDAGSDVGAGRARATANDDGSWNIRASSASSPRPRATSPRTSSTSSSPARWASTAWAAPAPRACSCSSCRSTTSTTRPAS